MSKAKQERITDILREYWEGKKGNAPYPAANDINNSDLADIWEDCFMIEVVDGGKSFRYEYLGDSIADAYADDLEGKEVVEDLLYPESPGVLIKFRETMQTCLPLEYEGAFINKNNDDIKFRKILMPIGSGGKVTYILGGMRWRAF
jgi:hypothetical protein